MYSIKVIFWDFDGVLMDSNPIRELGFERVLSEFPKEQVGKLLAFHRENGGLSRYVKFRYFFEEIRKEPITNEEILIWSERFSSIMKELLINPKLLVDESLNFVRENQGKYIMHITSGSDQNELRYLCSCLGIDHLFKSVHGSPKPKNEWIRELIDAEGYSVDECILIGDSDNDRDAAMNNNIYYVDFIDKKFDLLNSVK
jgi:phosphoglycolate phosphatase-like HAD superfamily hydrolase